MSGPQPSNDIVSLSQPADHLTSLPEPTSDLVSASQLCNDLNPPPQSSYGLPMNFEADVGSLASPEPVTDPCARTQPISQEDALRWDGTTCKICLTQTNIVVARVYEITLPGEEPSCHLICPSCVRELRACREFDGSPARLTAETLRAANASAAICPFCKVRTTSAAPEPEQRLLSGRPRPCHSCLLYRRLRGAHGGAVRCANCHTAITAPFWARGAEGPLCRACNFLADDVRPCLPWAAVSDEAMLTLGDGVLLRCVSCQRHDSSPTANGMWTSDAYGQPQCVPCAAKYALYPWLSGAQTEGRCEHCLLERAPYWHIIHDGFMVCHWCFSPPGDPRRLARPECCRCGSKQHAIWHHWAPGSPCRGLLTHKRGFCRNCTTVYDKLWEKRDVDVYRGRIARRRNLARLTQDGLGSRTSWPASTTAATTCIPTSSTSI